MTRLTSSTPKGTSPQGAGSNDGGTDVERQTSPEAEGSKLNEFLPAAAGASLLPVIAPELKVLLDYWLSLRAEGPVPDRGLFDPAVVKQLLARFWVIRRDPSTGRYRFTLAGEQIRELLGRKVTGVYIE